LALTVVAASCVIATSATAITAASSASSASSAITIGFVPENISDPFFVMMHYGALQEAKALGVHLLFEGTSGTPSPTAQLPYVDAVLAQHPSAFILGPTDPSALMPSVEKAHSLGIPVLTVDTTVSNTSLLASRITGDNVGGGKLAVKVLNGVLRGKGEVYIMSGSPSFTTENLRMQGFQQELPSYPGLKYEGFSDTNEVASTAETDTAHVLSRYPSLRGIFAVSDFIATGVIAELIAINKTAQVRVVAYDAEPAEVAALKKGQVVGVVAQSAAVEGSLAVLYAYDEVTHHTSGVVRSVVLPDVLITRNNVASESKWFYCTSLTSCPGAWKPTKADGAP
jgi:ribose transport system substrate-binding protein